MSIRKVRARVVDIAKDMPTHSDEIFVDTNSWFDLTYSRNPRPKENYAQYIKRGLESKATLFASALTLAELASSIEQTELEVFCAVKRCEITKKTFRHDCLEQRAIVVQELSSAWGQVESMATIIENRFDQGRAREALNIFGGHPDWRQLEIPISDN